MSTKEFQLLFRHELWANEKICNAILELPQPSEKSVKLINHILGAQQTWISRINGTESTLAIFPTIDERDWLAHFRIHANLLLSIAQSEENLERIVIYKNSLGQEFSNPVKEIFLQLILHSQYHRGQIVAYSRDLLEKVPPTDMIAFLRI